MSFAASEFDFTGFEDLLENISIMMFDGTTYTTTTAKAFASGYSDQELVAGDSIKQGDIKLIIPKDELDATVNRALTRKDRIVVRGKQCAVEHWDENTRSVGSTVMAINARVRG